MITFVLLSFKVLIFSLLLLLMYGASINIIKNCKKSKHLPEYPGILMRDFYAKKRAFFAYYQNIRYICGRGLESLIVKLVILRQNKR